MRKCYSSFLLRKVLLVLAFFHVSQLKAQVTVSSPLLTDYFYNSETAAGAIVFGVKNSNTTPIVITEVGNYMPSPFTGSFGLWYHTTAITGAPTAITTANGWVNAATVAVNYTGPAGITPIFTGLNITLAPGQTYRFAVSGPPSGPFYGGAGMTGNTISGGGLQILVQSNAASPGYGGAFPGPPANTPRSFIGSIKFSPTSTCVDPPVAGTAIAPSLICGTNNFTLDLEGNSIGTGQTYQWQSSTDNASWTNVGTASSSPLFSTSITGPTYFRASVTCGSTTVNSVSVLTTPTAPLSGVYSINKGSATGGTNFISFADAVARLSTCGVSGAVTFNVLSGSGPYNEQVTIPAIVGSSATRTITFNGNGETLSFSSANTSARAGILLNGADNIIIDSLVINGSAGTYSWGVVLTGAADNNIIRRCTINTGNLASTSTNYIGIVLNGSATATATSGNNANNNLFEKNIINSGYYGFYAYGNSAAGGNNLNNKFVNNIIRDNYANGIYAIYQSNLLISGNEVTRPTRTSSTTYGAVFLTTNCTNALVEKNRIHNLFDALATNTSTAYGVHIGGDATPGQDNKVINNLVYNTGGNGIIYGVYNTSGDYNQIYHNTISLDDAVATTGAAYGIYQTTAAVGIDIKNNLVSVRRSGTGTKRCIYFVTTTSTIISNNNIFYMNAPAGTNNHVGQFGTPTYTTLADWKTANGGIYDQQSISEDPMFASPSTGNYSPGNPLTSNTGANAGVTTDILGAPRSNITPDAGAYEFSFLVAGTNMSAEALASPAISASGCYTASEAVAVRVRNNSTTPIDFSVNPVTVTVNVTGAVTQILTTTVNTGTLASDATLDVAIPTPLNMSTAGVYTFNASTSVTGDTNPADNAMPAAAVRTKEILNAGVASVSPDNLCISQTTQPVLKTDGTQLGYSSLQWQQSTTPTTGFTNISGATTTPYTITAPITQTMYYRLAATCGSNTVTSPEAILTVNNPQVLSTTPAARCGTGTVTLAATANAGTDLNWYETATSQTPIGTGTSFVTPTLTGTTTYYVSAGNGGSTQIANHGLPTVTTTTLNSGLLFDLNVPVVLNSVDVYTTTSGGDVVITLYNSAGTLLFTSPTFTVPAGSLSTPQTLTLNWPIPAGTNYRILVPTHTSVLGYHSGTFPILLGNGVGAVTTGATATGTTTLNYFIYNMKTTSGCSGPRTPVIATINAAAALDVARDTTICNNAITALSVVSNLADYTSYIWSPATELYTDAAATIPYAGGSATTLYVKSATPGKRKYYINSSNSTCANIDSVTIIVLPSSITVSAVQTEICGGGTTTLSISEGEYGNGIQWYSSSDGVSYSPVSGANARTYTTPALTDTTWYKVEIKNGAGVVCVQSDVKLNVNVPQVLTTTPATRCSPGTVTLGATAGAGTSLKWYTSATSTSPVATGSSFVTPSLLSTTTYYVAAASGGVSGNVGMPAAITTTSGGVGTTNYGLVFDVLVPFTLQTVTIYPVSATSADGTVVIDVVDGTGTVIHTATVNVTGSPSGSVQPRTVTLNFNLTPGTNYKMRPRSMTGIASLLFEPSAGAPPGGNYGYPFTLPGVVSIRTSTLTAPPANDARPDLYYYFYNWVIGSGCESARTAVTATIATPVLEVAQDTLVCNNSITALTVTSNAANFDSYIWSPVIGLYTDAAATIPYTGGTATTVYARTTAAGKYKYYINAVNSATTCGNIDSVTVTVLPGTLAIAATRSEICNSGTTTISVPAGEYGNGLQWYTSADGVTYSPIAGATTITYTTPTLTTTTYYKLEVKNGAGVVCLQPTITVNVGTPLLGSTTPATVCGSGTTTLGAIASPAGATVNWYTSATGGLPVATGTSFTTPILSATTTYYAASGFGFTSTNTGRLAPVAPAGTNLATYALDFTITQNTTLNSVDVISAGGTSITVALLNSTGATQLQTTGALTVPANTTYKVNLGWALAPGTYRLAATGMTGNFMRENSDVTYPVSLGAVGQINGFVSALTGAVTTSASYYWFYNWNLSTGCESPRTAVVATVTPGPAFKVAKDSLVCNNGITTLTVESPLTNFDSYTWSPVTDLYTDASATIPYTGGSATTLYAKIGTAGIRKYYITANNSSSLCRGIDSVKLTVLPATLGIASTRAQICNSGATTLSLPAGEYGNAKFQWYTSTDAVAYLPIAGATTTTYTTPTLTATTYYKIEIKNGAGTLCLQPTITVSVGVPAIAATAPATRCDPGTVTIGATPEPAGATINWYAAATGGLPIATGTTYTTPALAATTTYYAASAFGFTSTNTGRLAPVSGAGTVLTTYALDFTITQNVTLNSVDVISAGGTSITVALLGAGGTPQLQTTGPVAFTANATQTVSLGWNLAPGTYRLAATGMTGNFIRENSNVTWPVPLGTVGQINGFVSALTGAVTTTASYYWFYNWNISTGCESARTPVNAVINGSISIDADPIDKSICTTGDPVVFSVTANGAITNYQWRKDGVNIPGATSAIYTINSVSAADAGGYDVIITGPCSTAYSDTAILSISAPTAITLDPIAQQVCTGGSVTFNTTATGAGPLGYQWRRNGVNITGAYGASFTINPVAAGDFGNYDVIVTGACTNDTSLVAALTVAPATTVSTQPVAQTVCAGNNVTFTAAGAGAGTLTYQWRKAGVNINTATSASFTITGVTAADAGNYDVVITGNCGSIVSAIAGLTVNAATTITAQPLSQSTCLGSNVTFSVTTTGAGTLTYQWRKGGVNINLATSSSYSIPAVTAADVANYDVVITASCGSVTSATASLLISAPGSWIGVQNTDWNNSANWCGNIPTSTTDVVITSTAPNMPILSNAGSARNITIPNGATLIIATGGTLNLYGNLTGAGVFTSTAGSIALRGATPQTVPAFTATNVIMNGTGGFALSGNTVVTGSLTLTNGNITLGTNNLRLTGSSTGSANSHVVTNGSGSVIVAGLAASAIRTVPVGTSATSYTPVTLTANAGHVTDDLSVRVQPQVLSNGTTGSAFDRFVVDRTWVINETVAGGSNVNITLQWNEGDELPDFGRNESYVMQYTGGAWVTGVETFANGTNPYTQTKTNVTSFSPLAVQTDPLPVTTTGVFPNPVRDLLNVIVRTNAPEKLVLSVYDMSGKLIKTQAESVGFGGTLLGVNVRGLVAGTYILKISIPRDKEFLVRKFVKVN